ncbi:MAG: hypothetical protein FJX72_07700 [Armatimonadetes bacterium]|nr:hypothetical protein [Armatimonadota bacterium]
MGWLLEVVGSVFVRLVIGRLFAMRPGLRARRGSLIARTSLKGALLTLGLHLREVAVDPRLQTIRIRARRAWVFGSVRRIPFDAVARVTYDWTDVNPFQHMPLAVYQELDLYTVSVVLKTGEVVDLCRFFGLGGWVNEHFMPDWVFWDDRLAAELARGSQEEASRAYAVTVARAVGVELERR